MSNIIDSIQVSGTVYQIQGSGGGNPTVELTQAQYDALVSAGTVSPTTYYIITDAEAVDLDNYYTKTEVDTALGGKQATLVNQVNIKSLNNQSLLGSGNIDIQGGGGSYEAGRGISIDTANTISFSLPISAGTKSTSLIACTNNNRAEGSSSWAEGSGCYAKESGCHAEGWTTKALNTYSHSEGCYTEAKGYSSHAEGYYTITKNLGEHSSGQYNNSVSASTTFGDSGNTLFSVGNGTANNARHNAFEIRQNGDIYCFDGTNDVKLQDTITATAANTTALGGLKLVKLTQQEYDNLTTKDSNTLYVIV